MAINKVGSKGIEDGSVAAVDFGAGAITNVKLADDAVTNAKLSNSSITASGTSIALGASGTFNNSFVDWQSIVVSDGSTVTTMVSGRGYFVNNTSAAGIVKLPASASIGDFVVIKDYAGNFGTNNLIIQRNSHNIQGSALDSEIQTDRASVKLVYVDATKGWLYTNEHNVAVTVPTFITATGGTVLTVGDFKTHVFTGDGNFVVASIGNSNTPTTFRDKVDYLVTAGGAGGGAQQGGGGGAGGFRMSNSFSLPSPTTSPLANSSGATVTATTFPITVGAGGAGAPGTTPTPRSSNGSNSVFSTITSTAGGGAGGGNNCGSPLRTGSPGGSGGGASWGDDAYNPPSLGTAAGGAGNTPPVSPSQGNTGGASGIGCNGYGGGGGGAGSVGGTPAPSTSAGGDGSFLDDSFIGPTAPSYGTPGPVGSTRYFAGGGAGRSRPGAAATELGGFGGGGDYTHPGSPGPNSKTGVANSGGGGGSTYPGTVGTGGKGIVLIRYKFQ